MSDCCEPLDFSRGATFDMSGAATLNGAAYNFTGWPAPTCQIRKLGAAASVLFFLRGSAGKWFCNESTGAPYIKTPEQYPPSKFWAIAMSMPGARDITDEFFAD